MLIPSSRYPIRKTDKVDLMDYTLSARFWLVEAAEVITA